VERRAKGRLDADLHRGLQYLRREPTRLFRRGPPQARRWAPRERRCRTHAIDHRAQKTSLNMNRKFSKTTLARREPFLDDLLLDRTSAEPLAAQIARVIRTLILGRVLEAGTKLPSSRGLAARLGLGRNTVLDAYDLLASEGWIDTHRGSGTFVALSEMPEDARNRTVPAQSAVSRRGEHLLSQPGAFLGPSGARILAPGVPAIDRFPAQAWTRSLSRAMRTATRDMLHCEDPRGLLALRSAIAQHLGPARGIICHPDQVIVLTSSRQGISIAAKLLAEPGDSAWVEDPGYPEGRSALRETGLHLSMIPVDFEGLDVAAARRAAPNARLAMVTPSHQYPLGVVMTASRRSALLQWAQESGAYIIEDDYDGEFRHGGQPVTALAGVDQLDRVIYVGTFSKAMFPALRIAYLVSPPQLADRFAALRASLDGHTNIVGQLGLADFIQSGKFGRHVRQMRLLYAERQQALLDAIARHLQDRVTVRPSHSGLHLVCRLLVDVEDTRLVADLDSSRFCPTALSGYHSQDRAPERGLVLGYAGSSRDLLGAGIVAVAAALSRCKVAP
jgi:GntR family transcriptional regulator/MocR family aminotransferase